MNYATEETYKGLNIKIAYDQGAENPFLAWDCGPDIIGWHRRYDFNTRKEDKNKEPEQFLREAKEKGYIVLPLYMYDHSGIAFSTSKNGYPFNCPWDSGQYGFIFWTREKIEAGQGAGYCKRVTAKKKAFLIDQLIKSVELLNQYVSGDVYGFIIENEDGEELDSCWGFYGLDVCLEESRSVADYHADKKEEVNARVIEESRPDMYAV